MKTLTMDKIKLVKLGIALLSLLTFTTGHAQFTSGNLVVLQVNDGVATFTNTGNAVILREFTPAGATGFSVNVPTSGTTALIVSGSATSEGALSLSANNKYLVFGGYAQAITNTISLASSTTIPRSVAIVDAAGNYSMVASSSTFHLGNNIRSATSDGNNNYWSAGGNDGTDYFGTSSPTVNIQNAVTNTRCINTFSNNLYFSTGSGTKGVYKIGAGLPTTSGQTNTIIVDVTGSGVGSQSPYAFFFNPSQTVCYIADDRSIANGGGIQKWVNSSSTWTLAYTIGTGSASTVGARGVVADFSGTTAVVYATTAESTNNRIISILDAGSTSAATTIATSTTNTIFRGLAFSPCNTPSITSVTSNGTICANQTLTLTANATSSSAISYAWNGTGSFASPTSSISTVTGATSGNYTIIATNGCGSTASTISITVLPSPTITINSSTTALCVGQTATLTASGASTYSWNTSGTSSLIVVSPTTNTNYIVTGTSNNCSATSSIALVANPLPALNINSITICMGQPGTLTASGAASYSWNTSSTSSSIIVTPTINTSYSITGTSSVGCLITLTTQVVVTSSPAIIVNSSTICTGASATLIAGGANTFTWSTGALTNSIVVAPSTNTVYSISGSLVGCAGVASNTAAVSLNPLPSVSVSGNTSVCQGSAISQTLSGAASYSVNGIASPSVLILTPPSTLNYSVTGTSSLGCSSIVSGTLTVIALPVLSASGNTLVCIGSSVSQTLSGATSYSMNGNSTTSVVTLTPASTTSYTFAGSASTGCSATTTKTLTVAPLPVIAVSGNTAVCSGSSISQTLSGATSYSWNGTSSPSVITITPAASANYVIAGSDNNGCLGTLTRSLTVNALPVILISSSVPTLCAGTTATITASGASTYSWANGAGSGASIVVTPTTTTTYSATGTTSNNCSATYQFVQNVSACTSIEKLNSIKSEATLYPNPASDFIAISNLNAGKNEISIVNAIGNVVLVENNYVSSKSIDISMLPAGVYFIQVTSNGELAVKKLVVEK